MTNALSAIDSVTQRINSIEQRFAPEPRTTSGDVISGPAFDPFGDAYQRAIEGRSTGAPTTSTGAALAPLELGRARLVQTAPTGGSGRSTGVQPRGSIGGYGSMPVPAELEAYGNGRVPAGELQSINQSHNHRLYGPAAEAWDRLVDAAAADGLSLRITDSYRSYDNQVDLVRRKGLYSEGGLAAKPGTSNHGWGLAVDADVTDPAMMSWIREHGPEFGWVEAVPREPWHWEYRPHQT